MKHTRLQLMETIANTCGFTFDLDHGTKVTQIAVQHTLHHVTYVRSVVTQW